jgi:hypothetical protein
MELMPGRTLKDLTESEGALPVNRAVDYMLDVIEGLEAAHAAGVIHRDVKPSNCFLDSEGRAKVGDFGLSKSLVTDASLTRTGAFMGTPLFAAPEQVRGDKVDERTDVYAVGATLFYLIANRGPFTGDAMAVSAQIVSDPAPSLASIVPAVPQDLAAIVARTLEKDRARRYVSLTDLKRALLPFASGGTSIAEVGRRLAAFVIDVSLVGLAIRIPLTIMGAVAGMQAGGRPEELKAIVAAGPFMEFVKHCVAWVLGFVYFTLAEGVWGRGVGKLLMGLCVVDPGGQRPGLARAAIRALFIPGGFGLSVAWSYYEYYTAYYTPSASEFPIPVGFGAVVFGLVSGWVARYVPWALCLSTMRAATGYRGVHEFASGTRVLRVRTASQTAGKHSVPVLAAPALSGGTQSYGPFRVIGSLRSGGPNPVLQAHDEVLQRSVWIFVSPRGSRPPSEARVAASRPTRPRWLQGGEAGEQRWDAFEAVVGIPLSLVGKNAPWSRTCSVLLDLAEELTSATADRTLPEQLTFDQVWIDQSGRLKLIDEPIVTNAESPVLPLSGSDTERALQLFRAAADFCTRGQVLPGRVQEFFSSLTGRPGTSETLQWVVRELSAFRERASVMSWDSRLGILGISGCLEFPLFVALAWLTAWAAVALSNVPLGLRLWLPTLVGAMIATIVGYFTHGGPVFQFMGIEVRRTDGKPASRWRCAWRNLLAWLPVVQTVNFGIMMMAVGFNTIATQTGSNAPFRIPTFEESPGVMFPIFCSGCCFEIFFFLGPVFAVASPQRGLQDLLAGTRLVPR